MEYSMKHLEVATEHATAHFYNPRGRPTKSKVIQFSAEPKSIISQLLQKNRDKAKTNKTIDQIESKQIFKDQETDSSCLICSYSWCKDKNHRRDTSTPKQYSCEYPDCTYSTKLSSNLIKHKRKHTSEKPFLCDQCTFRTNFINSLKVHKRIHTAEKPYACRFCSYKCNSSSNLKKHCHHRHRKNSP
ncbi:zinc finger protein 679-like [Battus philenor]|uniref:zinc finger protein 679-like n=1 Tax=Battus philenor TaxID=42288 RepID=UPI0035D0D51A